MWPTPCRVGEELGPRVGGLGTGRGIPTNTGFSDRSTPHAANNGSPSAPGCIRNTDASRNGRSWLLATTSNPTSSRRDVGQSRAAHKTPSQHDRYGDHNSALSSQNTSNEVAYRCHCRSPHTYRHHEYRYPSRSSSPQRSRVGEVAQQIRPCVQAGCPGEWGLIRATTHSPGPGFDRVW
jgi:hypothetical protein